MFDVMTAELAYMKLSREISRTEIKAFHDKIAALEHIVNLSLRVVNHDKTERAQAAERKQVAEVTADLIKTMKKKVAALEKDDARHESLIAAKDRSLAEYCQLQEEEARLKEQIARNNEKIARNKAQMARTKEEITRGKERQAREQEQIAEFARKTEEIARKGGQMPRKKEQFARKRNEYDPTLEE